MVFVCTGPCFLLRYKLFELVLLFAQSKWYTALGSALLRRVWRLYLLAGTFSCSGAVLAYAPRCTLPATVYVMFDRMCNNVNKVRYTTAVVRQLPASFY